MELRAGQKIHVIHGVIRTKDDPTNRDNATVNSTISTEKFDEVRRNLGYANNISDVINGAVIESRAPVIANAVRVNLGAFSVMEAWMSIERMVISIAKNQKIETSDQWAMAASVYSAAAQFSVIMGPETLPVTGILVGMSIFSQAVSYFTSDQYAALYKDVIHPVFDKYFSRNPMADYSDMVLTPDLTIANPYGLRELGGSVLECRFNGNDLVFGSYLIESAEQLNEIMNSRTPGRGEGSSGSSSSGGGHNGSASPPSRGERRGRVSVGGVDVTGWH